MPLRTPRFLFPKNRFTIVRDRNESRHRTGGGVLFRFENFTLDSDTREDCTGATRSLPSSPRFSIFCYS